jgi:hypothetical protein
MHPGNFSVTAQGAAAICRAENLDFAAIKERREVFLLQTGAKISYCPGRGYIIYGYHYAHRDTEQYRKYAVAKRDLCSC